MSISMLFPPPPSTQPRPHSRLSEEQLIGSALEMYSYSLSLHDKLPEKLHEAMLLWSFDPESKDYVKDYLIWVDICEKRKVSKIRFYKRMARINFLEKLNYVLIVIFLLFLFFVK